MGIGDWGLGIGDWGLSTIPNPHSPNPKPQSPIPNIFFLISIKTNIKINKKKYLINKIKIILLLEKVKKANIYILKDIIKKHF